MEVSVSAAPSAPVFEQASLSFVGRWQRLVSTTNWEKGRIISEWRSALVAAAAPAVEYSDEAWSRRVNNVTGQHVGRLRRVWERFGAVGDQYAGLYWSHFQAALDWNDAEMWLEGAVQSSWSVSQMRKQRWEALGAPPDQKPRDEEIVTAELDEDAPLSDEIARDTVAPVSDLDDANAEMSGDDNAAGDEQYVSAEDAPFGDGEPAPLIQPFATLPSLPKDLSDAFEAFKLGILRAKLSGWQDVACDDVLQALDALKSFAVAPAE